MKFLSSLFSRVDRSLRDMLFPEPTELGYSCMPLPQVHCPKGFGAIALAAELVLSVYDDDDTRLRQKWNKKFTKIDTVMLPGIEGRYALFTDTRARRHYIVIRGTTNRSNIALDLNFLRESDDDLGIGAHRGFIKMARMVMDDVTPRLRKGYMLHPVGHSLGGAAAELLGMMLRQEKYQLARVITFAAPKVTDSQGWDEHASLAVVRIVVPFDPVPYLPPGKALFKGNPYAHGGDLLMLLDGNAIAFVPPAFYDNIATALKETRHAGYRLYVSDHMLHNYLARLRGKKDGVTVVDPTRWMEFSTPTANKISAVDFIKDLFLSGKDSGEDHQES